MTDNEIMITLRRCADHACYRCTEYGKEYCNRTVAALAWDLMYRQKEEIERLNGDLIVERTRRKNAVDAYHEAKAQAIKEFADKVTDLIHEADDINSVSEWQIHNLVKEMTEEHYETQ